jgi:beta-carotene ketolase (CrtO type)
MSTIVIGGGHDGLVAAAYLAKTGKPVTVIEALDIVVGFCTTEELVSEAPEFKFNPTSLDHVLLKVEPSVITELGLEKFGLTYLVNGWSGRNVARMISS